MEKENMPLSVPNLSRRPATNGSGRDKDHPALPPDATTPAAPRSSTPTPRGAQRSPQKMPARSATIDQSTPTASAPKQAVQSSAQPVPAAPPNLPVPANLPPPPPAGSGQRTPSEEWVAIPPQSALAEELQEKVTRLETILKEKEKEIKAYQDVLKEQNDNLVKNEGRITYLENKCQNLESESYRQEVLSIRRHLQVDEQCEPWEINKKFGDIVRKIEDISRDLGEALGSLKPVGKHTTLDLLKLLSRGPEGQPLAAATPTIDLDLEDFFDFGCRALINEALFNDILGNHVFHPGLGRDDNALFSKMYNEIRRAEPQVVAGRWRISTLKLQAGRPYSPEKGALRLCNETLLPFCSEVIERKSCLELIQSVLHRFEDVFKRAYDWNRLAKSSVMLDFHPHFQYPGSTFEVHATILEGRKPKLPSSNAILLTSKLGLWSSNAIGGGKEPEFSFQTKATMLATEYFV